MLLLPLRAIRLDGAQGSNLLGTIVPSPRSNRHLHHRQADAFASTVDGCAGEQAISAFWNGSLAIIPPVTAAQRACVKGGIRARFSIV
jgi:hypothetical protein